MTVVEYEEWVQWSQGRFWSKKECTVERWYELPQSIREQIIKCGEISVSVSPTLNFGTRGL